jgi:hypothetical protein
MNVLKRFRGHRASISSDGKTDGTATPPHGGAANQNDIQETRDLEKIAGEPLDDRPIRLFTPRVLAMGIIVSIGGMIFGYDTGQISGFLEMPNFLENFADPGPNGPAFSNWKSGLIVALVCFRARLSFTHILTRPFSFPSGHYSEPSLPRRLLTSLAVESALCFGISSSASESLYRSPPQPPGTKLLLGDGWLVLEWGV